MEKMEMPIIKSGKNLAKKISEDILNCQPISGYASLIFRTVLWTPDMFKKSEPRQRIIIRNPFEQNVYDFLIREFGNLNDFVVYDIKNINWELPFIIDGWHNLIDEKKKAEISERYKDKFDEIFKILFDTYNHGDIVVYYDNIIPLSGRAGFVLIRNINDKFNIVCNVILKMS